MLTADARSHYFQLFTLDPAAAAAAAAAAVADAAAAHHPLSFSQRHDDRPRQELLRRFCWPSAQRMSFLNL